MKPLGALIAVLVGLCAAYGASGAVPDPSKSHCDPVLVGNSSGNDMGNAYHVIVRDVGNIPLAGKNVAVRFVGSSARPDLQQEAGTVVDCAAGTITRISDGSGQVTLHGRIAGFDNSRVVEVRAQGVLLSHILVRSTDLDGNGITDVRDLGLFRPRFLFDPAAIETDWNQDGRTDGFDLDELRAEILAHAQGEPCP